MHLGDSDAAWDQVVPLSQLLVRTTQRPTDADVTLFKSMGMGISDLALGRYCYEAVVRNGLGTPLEQPTRLEPRLRSSRGIPRIGYV
jgi:ornithine cyclodeaminase